MKEADEAFQCPICRSEFFTPAQTDNAHETWLSLDRPGYNPMQYLAALRNEYHLRRVEHRHGYTRILGAAREHWDAVLGQDYD